MKTASLLIALSILFNPTRASAETPRVDDAALLEMLRDENFDTRQDARDRLIARGLAVRELIDSELAKKDPDPDYKINLKAVAAGLRELDMLRPFDAPKRIDLELKDDTVAAALEKIAAHFGQNVIAEFYARDKKITLSIKGATFMESIDAVRRAAVLEFAPRCDQFNVLSPFSSGLVARVQRQPLDAGIMGRGRVEAAPVPDDKTLARFANLTLAERPSNDPDTTAVQGPFAVVFTRVETKERGNGLNLLHLAGTLYFNRDARFSRLKFASLKAVDGEKEYNLIASMPFPTAVQFHRILTGKSSESAPFMAAFTSMTRYQEAMPAGLTWKLTLGVEVPLKFASESVDLGGALFDKPQTLENGTVTVTSVVRVDDEWSAEFTLTGGNYFNDFSQPQGFNIVTESLPFAPRGVTPAGMSFLDAAGKSLPFRMRIRNSSSETGELAYKMDVRMDAKPKTMLFSRTVKTATREFEFTIPSVPVPLNKSEN